MAADLSYGAWRIVENLVGGLLNRIVERRSRLIAFYGHIGRFQLPPPPNAPPGAPPAHLHTHTVVVRNVGGLSAHNVRVPHAGALAAANVHVYVEPGVNYSTQKLPGGEEEILFPILVSKQQVTISYLYFPPLTFHSINLPIRSDEGYARTVYVLPTVQPPRWLSVVVFALALIGLATVAYGVFELAMGGWLGGSAVNK
jgi:hypothetical protein